MVYRMNSHNSIENIKQPVFGFTVLGSGSKGNACVIHCPQGKILLDAGFSAKELKSRLDNSRIDSRSIRAILVTHEHEDHVRGVRVFADSMGIPLYVTPETCRVMASKKQMPEKRVLITAGCRFDLCGITVEPFSVCHDVVDAVAYTFRCGQKKLGYATDLGIVNTLVHNKLQGCDALVIESNYDPECLRNSARPLHIKRRIMSRHGHLSNHDCMAALENLLRENTQHLVFAHLSSECNAPDIVMQMAENCLRNMNRTDVDFCVAEQGCPLNTCWLT